MAPVTFAVAPVEEGDAKALKTGSLLKAAENVQQFWKEQNANAKPLEFETGTVNHQELVESLPNAFIGTIVTAYNHHLPLILSPDDFWLVISLGVSQFLGQEENAEKYRKTFVDHEGKMQLVVDGVPLGISPKSPKGNKDGWPLFVDEIAKLIKQFTKTDTAAIMTNAFTTTGKVEATAFQISLMETMKNYFEYVCMLACGIPEITLTGEQKDYEDIIARVDSLTKLLPDFEWYLKRVRGHMERVLESYQGKPDQEWWRTMVMKKREGSGGQTSLSGWAADFFPYSIDYEGKFQANERTCAKFRGFKSPAVTFTPVILADGLYTMKNYDMKFVGGFIGTAKEVTDKGKTAVRPAIGWLTFYEGDGKPM